MTTREVYPHAPLALVAAEIRHAQAESVSPSQEAILKRELAELLPLSSPAITQTLTAVVGGASQVQASTSPRFTARDRGTAVTFSQTAITLETTRYLHFEQFLELLVRAVQARLNVGDLDGLERVGLRYIDEIRAPVTGSEEGVVPEGWPDWNEWIDSSLLGPSLVGRNLSLVANQWQGVMVFAAADEPADALLLRYGPGVGYALDPGGELKRDVPSPGPFFLLDVDSFWAARDVVPALTVQQVQSTVERLHAPARALFERLITDRLRDEVLRDEH